MFDMVV